MAALSQIQIVMHCGQYDVSELEMNKPRARVLFQCDDTLHFSSNAIFLVWHNIWHGNYHPPSYCVIDVILPTMYHNLNLRKGL